MSGFGAASSSCSYAAAALARSLFRKGANFTAAMAFEIATREQAERGIAGSMEGHAAMDMLVRAEGGFVRRLFSRDGFSSVSHIFVMEWAAIVRDLVAGLLIAGAIAAWVPEDFWRTFVLADHPLAAKLIGPLVGTLVAIATFVCSIGKVPPAVVLWKGGISFGGVIAFIYAGLPILPILNIYRKHYGARTAVFLLGTFFAAMAVAGYVVLVFLLLAAALLLRFWRTGGPAMLRMMGGSPGAGETEHGHGHAHTPHET
ncbi:permease [Streptomyces sp. NRRL S-646]|uniref:permease n=1 Tax=Streptomyces sp. NRRL S-646 TaxID=1463917 RepID=UPI000A6666B0|nr:permease [Streptomyces sp. NRRL S-646]